MGCALVISSLYPLYTFGRPFSGRHSINIFLICIELPVPVFLQKTALLASTSLEILERMPTLFCFLSKSTGIFSVSSPSFVVNVPSLTVNLTYYTRAFCVSTTTYASLLLNILNIFLYFSNALH